MGLGEGQACLLLAVLPAATLHDHPCDCAHTCARDLQSDDTHRGSRKQGAVC